jgi:spore coat-associated protein S
MSTIASEFAARREGYERMREAISHYGFAPGALVRVGSGYRVEGPAGPYFLKRFAFSPTEAKLMHEILEHLRIRGLPQVPRIHLTRDGQPFVSPGAEVYYLQDWLDLAPADLNDPATLATAVDLLSSLHRAAEGFLPSPETTGVREHYGSWLNKCVSRLRDMYSFAELAGDHRKESRFDARYAKASLQFDRQAEEAVRRMADLPLGRLADREREAGAVCHRNFSPRNLAMDGRSRLRLLDFDNAGREIRLEDLAKFVRRAGAQDLDRTAFILERYSQATGQTLGETELGLLSAHLLFPTEFWAVGNSRFRKDHRRERALGSILDRAEGWGAYANSVRQLKLPRVAGELVLPAFGTAGPAPRPAADPSPAPGSAAAGLGAADGPAPELPLPADLPAIPVFMTERPPAEPLPLARLDLEAARRQLALPQEPKDAAADGRLARAGRKEDNMDLDSDRRPGGQEPEMPAAQPGWETEVAKYVAPAAREQEVAEANVDSTIAAGAGAVADASVVAGAVAAVMAAAGGSGAAAPGQPVAAAFDLPVASPPDASAAALAPGAAAAEPLAPAHRFFDAAPAVAEAAEFTAPEPMTPPEPTRAEFAEQRRQMASRASTIVWGKWPKPKPPSAAAPPEEAGA